MQPPFARGVAFLVMAGLVACCPTLWVQVYKGDPAPWPPVPHTAAADIPFLIPSQMPNRFDVFRNGTPSTFGPAYTDTFYPGHDERGERQRAFLALRDILKGFQGGPIGVMGQHPTSFSADLVCIGASKHGLAANCTRLTTKEAPPLPKNFGPRSPVIATVNGVPTLIVDVDPPPADPHGPYMLQILDQIDPDKGITVPVTLNGVSLSTTMLSFLHFSDIQLRDPSVTLTDPALSAKLDWFQPFWSFQYDTDLAYYNQYLVQAVFETVNALYKFGPEPDQPKFLIHTGDSIDSGSMSELIRFHALIDRLRIPFYELFGNHDLLVFGNLTPTTTHADDSACALVSSLLNATSWFVPNRLCVDAKIICPDCIGEEGELVARATMPETRQHFISQLQHRRYDMIAEPAFDTRGDYCPDTRPKVRFDGYTRAHGFDLGTVDDNMDHQPLGYYAFVQKLSTRQGEPERNAVFVGLDSEDLPDHQGGIEGRIGHAQFLWLQRVLQCVRATHPADLVFVFAHQPLGSIDVEPQDQKAGHHVLAEVLAAAPNVVGYLYGHNHANSICGDRRGSPGSPDSTCSHFWEVETSSLIEFPQEGRLVRIKQVSQSLAYLEVAMVRERLEDGSSDLAKYTTLARQGAERDYCHNHPSETCKTYKRPLRTDGRDTDARLFFRLPSP